MPSSIANMWMPPLKRLRCPAEQRRADDGRDELERSKQNGLRSRASGPHCLRQSCSRLLRPIPYRARRTPCQVSMILRALQAAHSMARLMR